jgi:hypothetical protein
VTVWHVDIAPRSTKHAQTKEREIAQDGSELKLDLSLFARFGAHFLDMTSNVSFDFEVTFSECHFES